MKKFLVCLIGLVFIFNIYVYPSDQWREGMGQDTILGGISPSDIDKDSFENVVNPLDRMLAGYRQNCEVQYLSASTLTVKAGEVMLSNSGGTIRLMQRNTSDTTVTWSDIDTPAEAASTTYYVYAYQETVTTATFSVTISTSSSAPTGKTYYARLGSFYNDSSSNIVNDNTLINDNDNLLKVSIGTGTIANGGTIPLPSGYIQSQCKWMVSVGTYTYGIGDGPTHQAISATFTANASRVVTVTAGGGTGTANYIIIGQKP